MPGGYEWLIIIAVLLLLFGAKKLPEMARSVGQSARVFKGEMKGLKDDDARTRQGEEPKPAQELPAAAPAPQQTTPAPQQQAPQQPQAPAQATDRPAGPAA
ncbi:Twin-arginine translocation protein TatA [Pseudonocardia sp. Ae406_Ps2]|uniref:Sec-independent protein translocase subunit TatA n=1 Tax=unclassified Pseudonocardia TaxID=2619320 RepID=UPI00094AC9A7|nr:MULTISPECIES: Sec-independent protein translocase subunit TatA [unclassified Pseudonocardia]OLM00861.1 Twin-arginine translocation protein TatA [Pseudonocardia sp. Ae406_Ps2]OLM07348.1 Twin-arginine translocation protein TatA [Pseudonocardia sp. Ae331_Ps2]OLM14536.1 Twin-arginine translocation protein TatA [Pseudonocardia sp. Ae505_Ps2]OLM22439.1 Twin-arginine translocation protein TatA [Pseudonocardia sp. Ae706_Ps2]OLM31694.1 Twin-arginine translocation protein TatA [Pseudonocardia sp. Ae7